MEEQVNEFEVIFLMDDKVTVLETKMVPKGAKAIYTGKEPEKEATLEGKYIFDGWENAEQLESVTGKVVCIAKFRLEANANQQDAMYQLSQENAEATNLNDALAAGQKVAEQEKALEQDPRSVSEIVNDIKENGKTEIGAELNKDNIEK